MLIGAIVCSVGLVVCGIICWGCASDCDDAGAIISGILHVGCAVAATVLFCLDSALTSLACGGLLTATTGCLIIFQCMSEDDDEARLSVLLMSVADFACAMAGYICIFDFFALGISCAVLCGLAIINFGVTFVGYEWKEGLKFHIPNMLFTVVCAAGVAAGFIVNAELAKEISVEAECAVYKYDQVNAKVEENEETELYFNEYYALQVTLDWSGLWSLGADSQEVEIKITFPAATASYISEGTEFTKSGAYGIEWTCKLELNSKTHKQFKSGYFIFNYSYSTISIPVKPFRIKVSTIESESTDSDGYTATIYKLAYETEFKYAFKRRSYQFGSKNVLKDLSFADDGYYRISPPNGCNSFTVKIFNSDKTGIYYSETVAVSGEYYLLQIPNILKNNLNESVYNRIKERKESLVIEVTAVGNDNYADTSLEFTYAVE